MAYYSIGSDAQRVQLQVEELVVQLSDTSIVTVAGTNATIDVQQTITSVVDALFIDDSAGTSAPVVAANRSVSGTTVTLSLSATLVAADSIRLCFKVN